MTGPAGPAARQEAATLLGVEPGATQADVQRAFLRAARRVHPDVLPDAGDAERREAAVAFDRLLRARDLLLAQTPAPRPAGADPGGIAPSPPQVRADQRGIGGSLVVLALLSFLLVLLVTAEQGFRGGLEAPDGPVGTSAPGLP